MPIGGTQWMGGTGLDGGDYPLDAAISKKLDDTLVNRKRKSKRVLIRMHWRGRRGQINAIEYLFLCVLAFAQWDILSDSLCLLSP